MLTTHLKSLRSFFLKWPENKNKSKRLFRLTRCFHKRKYYMYARRPNYVKFSLLTSLKLLAKKTGWAFVFYFCYNRVGYFLGRFTSIFTLTSLLPSLLYIMRESLRSYRTIAKEGFFYLRALICMLVIDATFTDDEPLWEPIEWSLVMTWILFIFIFAWIAENLITSRYGSYTGRDKRVWFGWFKTYWLLNSWFALSYGTAAMFVILPFYSELVYPISFAFSWWHWYTRVFSVDL